MNWGDWRIIALVIVIDHEAEYYIWRVNSQIGVKRPHIRLVILSLDESDTNLEEPCFYYYPSLGVC